MTTYKGHTIRRTETRLATTTQPLYEVEGQHSKDAGTRPFLPSLNAARDWINEQITAEAWFPSTEGTHSAGRPLTFGVTEGSPLVSATRDISKFEG